MKKNKKAKADKAGKKSLLSGAAKSLKKLRKTKLSTTQKVVGGAALVALGLGYLSQRRGIPATPPAADASAAEENLAAMDESSH